MPKLTINSVCTKGPVYPIIFNFQNGYPSEDFECKCASIQDDKGKKTIAAEFGRFLYVGVEEDKNMDQTLLLVRNRKTGKVRLLETGRVDLKPIIDNRSQQFTLTSNSEMSEALQKHLNLETGNLEPTMSPGPQQSIRTQYLESSASGMSIKLNDQEITHQPDNRNVKPVQYQNTSVKRSKTNVERQQLEASLVTNSLRETGIDANINSNNPKLDNSSIKHRSKSKPNKKGSTSRFSPKRSGCFRHLYNFVVDEIEAIPNDRLSETECNKSPKSINQQQILNEDANETIKSKELLRGLLEEKVNDKEPVLISSENIRLTADVSVEDLNEGNKNNSSIMLEETEMETKISSENDVTADVGTEELNEANKILSKDPSNMEENVTNIETEGLTTKKINAIDLEDQENSEIISSEKLPRVILEEKSTEIVTEGKETENIQLTLTVPPTEKINKAKTKTASIELPRNMLEENVSVLESEGIASENELTVDVGTEELKEANNMISDEENEVPPEKLLKENETDLETEDISSTIDIKELSIFTSDSLSIDTSEFEGENSLKSKLEQEYDKEHYELTHKNYSVKEYYVAALGLDLNGEKKKRNSASSTSSYILTNGRTKNYSLSSNQTENIYICDYCDAVFENKGSLIFHRISHEFVMGNNDVIQSNINNIIGTDIDSENERNKDFYERSDELKDGENKKNYVYVDIDTKNVLANNEIVTDTKNVSSENTYICDYCGAVFENKGALVFHLTSHEFVNDKDNGTQLRTRRMKGNNNDNNKINNENKNACPENYRNTIDENRNPDLKENFNDFKNGENGIYNQINDGHIVTKNSYICVAEIGSGTDKITHDLAIKLINCKHCDYKTDETSDILKHILTHRKDNTNQCEATHTCKDCGREYKSEAALIIHIESHKNNSNRKPRTGNTKSDPIDHLTKIHKSTKPYRCNLCDFKFSSANELTIHSQTHKIKPFKCDICKYQCHKNNFVKHMKSHTDIKPFQCKLCDSNFAKNSGLKQHMVTHTGIKEHKCKICDSKFSLLSGLNRHLLIHSKDKPFECAICYAGFNDKSALKRHQKIHTGEKRYKCTHCEYSCITGSDLKRHMKTHDSKVKQNSSQLKLDSGITEPFQCTMCDSKFSLKNSLICHMKIHTGEKTHKCTFCDKVFIHFSGLKRHLNVHTKNKPVKCTTCNTSYDNETGLKWHLRRSKKHQ